MEWTEVSCHNEELEREIFASTGWCRNYGINALNDQVICSRGQKSNGNCGNFGFGYSGNSTAGLAERNRETNRILYSVMNSFSGSRFSLLLKALKFILHGKSDFFLGRWGAAVNLLMRNVGADSNWWCVPFLGTLCCEDSARFRTSGVIGAQQRRRSYSPRVAKLSDKNHVISIHLWLGDGGRCRNTRLFDTKHV